ncbi:M43 family zinc metalloprotease [Roseovarius aestuariivivens]|uniref:M43 family zinc metalloprotease n=1 Tax=Roseovarius aestuariivivens TaxID=1888910 RepID=UPI001AEBF16E|nr:M43 family zinc metalloprotease [Roseovarius aestuariivivens]
MAEEETPRHRGCGTMSVHRRLLDTDPGYARRLARIEEQAFRARSGFMVARPGCTLIPVVVHVVYKTDAQNVSQAQIDSQIDVLNRDFRKTNPDVSSVPAPFSPLAGDARIQFELASTDPQGNPHSGVIRKETDRDSFSSNDDVKFDARGGSDAWPRDEYLNIWVCQLSGGLLGYAQFPGGPADTDGVVVTHTGFGTTGTAAAPFDKGRTTTHEIGHWLNLRHIWGDDGAGCSGSDFVDDTPNQGGPNTGKPTFPTISCNNGPNGDMFMNYMDYVDDDTMVMFTEGQIQRMHACLDGPRSSIGTSIPCGPGPVVKLPKEPPKEIIKEFPKDPPKEFPKDPPKEIIKELPKDPPKDFPKDPPKEFPKDGPKDFPKEFPKDPPKEIPKDPPKEFQKEPPKDFPKEGPFDPGPKTRDPGPKSVFEPGPKSILEPGPDPKSVLEPGPKTVFEPGPGPKTVFEPGPSPKSALEPPIGPSPGPFPGPIPIPLAGSGQPATPFVLGTGRPEETGQADGTASALGQYAQLLAQYAGLYQRGMLDAQGMAAWQQLYATYRQLGGQ